MADRVADWVGLVDALYPERDAADWDNSGLQVGDPDDEVTAVLVCLDVTADTLAEATAERADLLVAHHPLLFRPLHRLTPDTAAGQLALAAARAGVAVLAAHTNLDVAVGGTSDPMVELLGLTGVRPLQALRPGVAADVKLVTFVPAEHTPAVLAALSAARAGVIGEYDHCSFRVAGTGSFRPSAQASPAVGERGELNEVTEDRLEIVVPRTRLGQVVAALWEAHPYEEVAYDLYPLMAPVPGPGQVGKGLGRVGDLPEPRPLRWVADTLATGLSAPHLRVAGDLDREVRTVAVCGGAGDSLIDAAVAAGADVYVTGDLRHHPVLDATAQGVAVVDAGHYATEAAALPGFVAALREAAAERGLASRLVPSAVRTEPWAAYQIPPTAGVPGPEAGPQPNGEGSQMGETGRG